MLVWEFDVFGDENLLGFSQGFGRRWRMVVDFALMALFSSSNFFSIGSRIWPLIGQLMVQTMKLGD